VSTLSDHGIEVLRKAGEEVVPGFKKDTYIKVGGLPTGSTGTIPPIVITTTPKATTLDHFNGTVGVTSISEPATPGNKITNTTIENTSTGGQNLLVSFDGGVKFKTLEPGDAYDVEMEESAVQIDLKGSAAGTLYETVITRVA